MKKIIKNREKSGKIQINDWNYFQTHLNLPDHNSNFLRFFSIFFLIF